jgi:hypothetical protein
MFGFLDVSLSFLKNFGERKTHNMFALMLNPEHENLKIVYTFIGKELGVGVVKDYDKKALFFLLLKTYQFLHLLANSSSMAKRASDEDSNIDILEMSLRTIETSKEVVKQEVNLFHRYSNIKDIRYPLD